VDDWPRLLRGARQVAGSARNPDRTRCWEFFSYHGSAGMCFDWADSLLYHLSQYTITAFEGRKSLNMEAGSEPWLQPDLAQSWVD